MNTKTKSKISKKKYALSFILISSVFAFDCIVCNLSQWVYGNAQTEAIYNKQMQMYYTCKNIACLLPYLILLLVSVNSFIFDWIDKALILLTIFFGLLNVADMVVCGYRETVYDWYLFTLFYLILLILKIKKYK